MKKIILALACFAFLPTTLCWAADQNVYSFKMKDIDGQTVDLKKFEGKTLLIVNTASECGYTHQYEPLEKIYQKYKDKGLVVLGFPSNDFGGQEPGTEKEIKAFCQARYDVKFPMFSKIKVKGEGKADLYKWLTEKASDKGEVKWNFEKFLINKKGQIVSRYRSKVDPMDSKLTQAIEKVL